MNLHSIERFEKLWIGFAAVLLLGFGLSTTSNVLRAVVPVVEQPQLRRVNLAQLAQTPFADARLRKLAPRAFEIYITSQAFVFSTKEIRLKAGDSLQMHVTSRDVMHGFQIVGTNVNVQVIPGEVATVAHTFRKPGVYLIVCNEYCGTGHHLMLARIVVEARDVSS